MQNLELPGRGVTWVKSGKQVERRSNYGRPENRFQYEQALVMAPGMSSFSVAQFGIPFGITLVLSLKCSFRGSTSGMLSENPSGGGPGICIFTTSTVDFMPTDSETSRCCRHFVNVNRFPLSR